jgi:hypothetical protein
VQHKASNLDSSLGKSPAGCFGRRHQFSGCHSPKQHTPKQHNPDKKHSSTEDTHSTASVERSPANTKIVLCDRTYTIWQQANKLQPHPTKQFKRPNHVSMCVLLAGLMQPSNTYCAMHPGHERHKKQHQGRHVSVHMEAV